jgi:phosphoenolpyruvate carboxykinase (GTP)
MRVLDWIVRRVKGNASAMESPVGWVPRYEEMDWTGIQDFSKEDFMQLMTIDREPWKQELLSHEELFSKIYDRLPKEFLFMRELLLSGLWRSPEKWGQQAEEG